jgi:Mg-chelatase subunit ChlD
LKTIIESLDEEDDISIISFSNEAKKLLSLTKMNKKGKEKALEITEGLKEGGGTNIWDGLKVGLETLDDDKFTNQNSFLLLLTDGLIYII